MKSLSTLLSTAISRSQQHQENADNLTWVQSKSTIYCAMPPPPVSHLLLDQGLKVYANGLSAEEKKVHCRVFQILTVFNNLK